MFLFEGVKMNTNVYPKKEIIKTTLPEKYAVSKIVYQYRLILGEKNHPISLRKLANNLNHILNPIGGNISHQSIKIGKIVSISPIIIG